MTDREKLGACRCPLCGHPAASVRLSGKGLAYMVCDACNSQLFARSGRSDELLRDRIVKPAPAAAPAAPAPEPAPAATARIGWGVLG